MKRLQMRFITSFLLLIFCIGTFAIGSVFAASPPSKTDTVSAKSTAVTISPITENFNLCAPMIFERQSVLDENRMNSNNHAVNLKFISDSFRQPDIVRLE